MQDAASRNDNLYETGVVLLERRSSPEISEGKSRLMEANGTT